jgi:hypothetical protein
MARHGFKVHQGVPAYQADSKHQQTKKHLQDGRMNYQSFLQQKNNYDFNNGFEIHTEDINPVLFDWQKAIVKWAVKKGKAALYEDCGLGKTFQQIEWLRIILSFTRGYGFIVCPLSVAEQTINEGEKLNIKINYVKDKSELQETGIFITNYERLEHFENINPVAIVLDESSILKSVSGKIKEKIISMFKNTPYKFVLHGYSLS